MNNFQKQIWNLLPYPPDQIDRGLILSEIERFHSLGWTIEDIVHYLSCMEEVNPFIEEEKAILRMKEIAKKYEK